MCTKLTSQFQTKKTETKSNKIALEERLNLEAKSQRIRSASRRETSNQQCTRK